MKKEIRIIGIDDAPFDKHKKGSKVLVIGTMFRGGSFMDGVMSCYVEVDGEDSTRQLIKMINNSKFKPQLQVVMLDGIALGGFNVVDIGELSLKTKLPVIVVIRNYPDFDKIESALKKLNYFRKLEMIKRAGKVYKMGDIYVQLTNINLEKAKEVLKISSTHGLIPEPVRVAHLIASGIVKGESRGRA